MRHRVSLVAACFVLSACAATGPAGGSSGGNPDLITTEEIRAYGAEVSDAYRLVQRIRPGWLRTRVSSANGTRQYAAVLLDGRRYGELDSLRDFSLLQVLSLEFLSATEATTRFGTGYLGGAILVTTQR